MTLIKKRDVPDYLRDRRELHLCKPVTHPDAATLPIIQPEAIIQIPSEFVQDYSGEHSIPGASMKPTPETTGSFGPQTPVVSKSARL
jgi:hypothetical protein